MAKRNFKFVPAYYEWHLVDKKGNIWHNMLDPGEDLLEEEEAEPMTLENVIDFCSDELTNAQECYNQGKDYNGIRPESSLTAEELKEAANIMGKALYDYYIAA